ncbi:hypothetical protein [Kineococcus sp. SYSU DK003]|uniref:hypothetical protein n=1 Tax=Kineococcus sp. SYSU DK003 TaxID=3383124 RepID=UPI003D7CA1E7
MAVIRGPLPTDNFTMVSNDWARDVDLTYKAKGILLAIASHAEGYRLTLQQLVAQGKDGRDAVKAGLRELVDEGYMRVIQNRGENGQMGEVDYILTGKLSADDAGVVPAGTESARSRQRRTRSAPVTDNPPSVDVAQKRRSEPVAENPSPVAASEDAQDRRSEPVADFPSPGSPSTESPPLRRTRSKKTNTYVTSTSARDVTVSVDNSEGRRAPSASQRPVATVPDAVRHSGLESEDGNDVDLDEVERTLLHLPDRLRPSPSEARRLRGLIEQRMRRGWAREDIVHAVERRLRPGGTLDNPCGLFAKVLVPLEEAPRRVQESQPRRHLTVAKPWCGSCDEETRYPRDENGFPDMTLPKCPDCKHLEFAHHMERGAS